MDKSNTPAQPVPTFARAGVTPGWNRLQVVDAKTGKTIERVMEVDTDAGRVVRMDVDQDGNLQIVDDKFKTIEEDRKVRLEWVADPDEPAPVLDADAAAGAGGAIA